MTDELLEQWSANNDRLHWIQAHREELRDATDLAIPKRLHELETWLETRKGVVTRRLRYQGNDTADETDVAADDTDDTDTSDS